ncbi:MAG: hypothetical protein KatS3mg087_1127 [Patescibacteria group bacterium]|nr:MAG: hypothetical protein KatS3mg087_1127 [Patescibacteria group bacterium]
MLRRRSQILVLGTGVLKGMARNMFVHRAEESLTRASKALSLVLLCCLWAHAQEPQPKEKLVVAAPAQAVRGQLVWIRLAKTPTHVSVLKASSGIDEDVSINKADSSQQLVCIDQTTKQSWIFSCPETGTYYVNAYFYDEERKALEIDSSVFSIVNEIQPPPPPQPEPSPAPFVSQDGLRVLILSEIDERKDLSPDQLALFASADFRKFLEEKTVKESDGTPGYRVWDDDYTDSQIARVAAVWQEAFKAGKEAQRKFRVNHVMLVASPKGGEAIPLPKNVDEAVSIVQKYAP